MAESLPVQLRPLARRDVEQAVDHLREAAGPDVAMRFVDAFERGLELLGELPSAGSPRLAAVLDLPGLRSLPIGAHPYLILHVVAEDGVDVWRVLHARRDVAGLLVDPDVAPGS